ncbi:pre-16S rRNA-processing nuclease YqgF [Natroniella sulfidigena]|uniref:pre-16S rRNA-processing nuclease YqgF n=1 Tax=Natroniella sulfidigena TaxID=723921 RepID=UPI00200A5D9C|nr:pre-16S rRNA-processing nuclease YqgF [Natroniella sulfidigena]MCK8816340.1 pre-16S rRNA-processing nuclease YqgF [Natroniella sulfidigena]
MILAIDPGRGKCGIAVVDSDLAVAYQKVISTEDVVEEISKLMDSYQIEQVVLGNGTASQLIEEQVAEMIEYSLVDETNSTLEARDLYWTKNPPSGWRKFLPLSLQTPPEPVDDYVAIILARRYFSCR